MDLADRAVAIMQHEARAISEASGRLREAFSQAIEALSTQKGHVVVSGIGKAGLIGTKISATLASMGTPSFFLHPSEALHGDLGRIRSGDIILILSASGETDEIVRLLPSLEDNRIIAITAQPGSTLARRANVLLAYGECKEACHLGLAPTASTAVMLAIGDALALTLSEPMLWGQRDFARYHPGGSLGRKLSKVEERMRPLSVCRVAKDCDTVEQAFIQATQPGRRPGAILVTNDAGDLVGLFTDSDLARIFETKNHAALGLPINQLMTANPTSVEAGSLLIEAIPIMTENKYSELPVLKNGKPLGLLDITDVMGMIT